MSNQASTTKAAPLPSDPSAERPLPANEMGGGVRPADLGGARQAAQDAGSSARNLEMVMRIPVSVKIVLGSATMPVSNLVALGRGAVIPLDRRVGEPVDVVVNGRIVARGEVVVMDDDNSRFGVSLTEVVEPSGSSKAT